MSLRLQLNLLIAGLVTLFVVVVFAYQVVSTRSSVREEIEASNLVATQMMSNYIDADSDDKRLALVNYLSRLGHVRAAEISLRDEAGGEVYHSPPATYKAGRDAPDWYAALVTPAPIRRELHLPGGNLVIEANASRAVLDGWDDAVRMFEFGIVIVVLGNLFVFWLVRRTTRPFQLIEQGLEAMQGGAYHTRLPAFANAEAAAIARAFNEMAQSIEDNLGARREALEANIRLEQSREFALTVQNRIEEERRHIARELHDETGQSVTAIRSLALSLVHRLGGKDEQARETAQLIGDTAARLYAAMHDLIPRLRPLALENLGLGEVLEEQLAEWRRQYPQVEFTLALSGLPQELGESCMLAVYRIIQEATVNALRHSDTRRIDVTVQADAGKLSLDVRDHGRGLAPDWKKPGHFGIRGMCERARVLGGEGIVENAEGGGVRVRAMLPLE
ncbi:MAG TPA: sensor histidine kinase [Rudaea sp.]|jgi:two-component system sensor histidine kinase UhpB|nr:sensor histidine kinase [Rudaea sp.]